MGCSHVYNASYLNSVSTTELVCGPGDWDHAKETTQDYSLSSEAEGGQVGSGHLPKILVIRPFNESFSYLEPIVAWPQLSKM